VARGDGEAGSTTLDGRQIEGGVLTLVDDGERHEVVVRFAAGRAMP
jgi:hypothetical protein